MNQTLMEKTRSLLLTASLPKYWWREAMSCATFLINRTMNVRNIIPHERLTGRSVHLLGLHPWGCKAFRMAPKATKFND